MSVYPTVCASERDCSNSSLFSWHIVDSQSFPLSLPEDPILAALSQNGAYAPGMIYSPEDVECIVKYAGERGIDVVVNSALPASHSDAAD